MVDQKQIPPTFRVQIDKENPAKEKDGRKSGEGQGMRREKCPLELVLSVTDKN